MKDYLKLLKFLDGHWHKFAFAVTGMLFAGLFEVFSYSMIVPMIDVVFTKKKINFPNQDQLPQVIQDNIDKLNAMDPSFNTLVLICVMFMAMLIFKNIIIFFYQYLMSDVSQSVMRDIRYRLYATIQHLSLDYFSKKRTGELVSRITFDVNLIENAVSYGFTDLFRQSFMIIFWVIMSFLIDPMAAVVIFFIFPFIGIPMGQIGKKLKKISRGIQEKMADINSHLLETISGVKLIKAFNTENYENKRFSDQNNSYYKLKMKSVKRLIIISPLTDVLGSLCGVGLILWLGEKLINEQISFGVFGYFMACFMNIISPVKKLGNVNAILQQALSANSRIYDVLDSQPTIKEKKNAVMLPEISSSIKISNAEFQYDVDDVIVLKDINLEVKKGELVAIVGPTGSGKTTLVNLLPRFYDCQKGEITIDGINVKDVDFKSLRKQFGIVSQETILFNDTVKGNIDYGENGFSQEEIESAAKKAYAHRFIVKLPKKYDTIVGDRGFRLSGGEKQRLSIARAILKNPPILILDEATSALDSESEKFVQDALDELMQGRTVVAIAHRLSTIKKADKIIVIENGRIIGTGKHDELLKSCPLYKKLHSMQFQA